MRLAWTASRLDEKLLLKRKIVLGPDDGDDKTVTILNRLVTWVCVSVSRNQIEIEATSRNLALANEIGRYQYKICDNTSSKGARVDSANAYETRQGESSIVEECNNESELHIYQSCRCATSDTRDCTIHVRAKRSSLEHSQTSDSASCRTWQARANFSEQRHVKAPRVDTDSHSVRRVRLLKRVRQELIFHGLNLLKAGSWTQGTRRVCVAESEFYAGVNGAWILLGAKSMLLDFGEDVGQCVLGTDSRSAKSLMERGGGGRIRHLHCPMLWRQKRVDTGEIRTEKRKGEHNTADIGTKAVSAKVLRRHLKTLKMEWTTSVSVTCSAVTA